MSYNSWLLNSPPLSDNILFGAPKGQSNVEEYSSSLCLDLTTTALLYRVDKSIKCRMWILFNGFKSIAMTSLNSFAKDNPLKMQSGLPGGCYRAN